MRVTKNGDIHVSASVGMPRYRIDQFIAEHRDWIVQAIKRMEDVQSKRTDFYSQLPLDTAQACREATDRLNALIPPLIVKYQEQMGVVCSGISYRRSKTRWGSCNHRTRHINFSVYLLLLPDWCAEHVVVHELAHLIEPNHSPAFYAIMDRYFPRWREARGATKRIIKEG